MREIKFNKKVIWSKQDGIIKDLYYLILECGHKGVQKTTTGKAPDEIFCCGCFIP